jgi:hypothetical protein
MLLPETCGHEMKRGKRTASSELKCFYSDLEVGQALGGVDLREGRCPPVPLRSPIKCAV